MATTALRKDEGLGLAVAIALHAALLAVLVLRPTRHETIPPPQRIEVTISDDIALKSTAPNPSAMAAPDVAPELGEAAPDAALSPPEPEAQPSPLPPAPVAPPIARPAPPEKPRPAQAPAAKPKPQPKPAAKPQPARTVSSPIDRIVSAPSKPATKTSTVPSTGTKKAANVATKPAEKAGGSRIGADFLSGMSGAKASQGKGTPASEIGPEVKSALFAAIRRQLKPHWQVPQGVDTELLVTRVRFRLNPDGSLAGDPQVVSTTGQTDGNAAQVKRHQEQAVRAVRLAAPFDLPQEYYQAWKTITSTFDRNLAQ